MKEMLNWLALMGFIGLIALYFLHTKLDRLLRRIQDIEDALGVETELKRALQIATDVEEKISAGKIDQAIRLHRSRHDITVKEAQDIIKRHATTRL